MAKREKKIRKSVKGKRTTHGKGKRKILVKRKFYNAVQALRQMKPKEQKQRTKSASKEFINDVTNLLKNKNKASFGTEQT